ncbi:hypothetical protein JHK87_006065 [Glycine soja]|nr:hypothetical protein JHK87_006065 [Glycine soja]
MVGREELSKAIRKIMDKDDKEGCVMRERAKELKQLAERAWSHDGPSYLALSKITHSNGIYKVDLVVGKENLRVEDVQEL